MSVLFVDLMTVDGLLEDLSAIIGLHDPQTEVLSVDNLISF